MSVKPSDLEKGAASFEDIPFDEEEGNVKEDVEEQAPVKKEKAVNQRVSSRNLLIGLLLLFLIAAVIAAALAISLSSGSDNDEDEAAAQGEETVP